MVTADTPRNPQPLNYSVEVQLGNSPLDRNDYSQVVKEIYLRHLVDGSIKQNEAQHITTGVQIYDMQSKRMIVSHEQDKEQFAASINKLPVSLLLLEDLRSGKVSMNQKVIWTANDRRGGFGNLDTPDAPLEATVEDLVQDMLNKSGNTALRVIVNNVLQGPQAVNDRWSAKPQLSHTRLQLLDATRFYLGNSTPHDSLWTIQQLMSKQDKYASFMKKAMSGNIFTDFGVRSQLGDSDYVLLVNKIGLLDDVEGNNRHDVGIIYNKKTHKSYAYSFMTTAPYDESDTAATVRADQSLKDMGQYTLRYAGGLRAVAGPGGTVTRPTVEKRMDY
ncbi:MAG TPA: serine hydrolase [Candidatus Saccharimonadales bacterium]|nr:serine hydrolase [Candidatus Saccharimonadales bacterium]